MLSRKKYVVDLSGDEREHLKAVISKGKSASRTILKARILLKADPADLRRTSPGAADRARLLDPAAGARSLEHPPAGRQGGGAEDRRARPFQHGWAGAQKNDLKPHLSKYWVIPPTSNAAFVAAMEDVLAVYTRPHDGNRPLVCLDETSKQLVGETRAPMPVAPGRAARHDYEYKRNGTANLFMLFAPLEGWRHIKPTARRTAIDYAHVLKELSDVHFPRADTIVLVQDNLNTHAPASLYEAFPPAEARRIAERFEWHYSPKHGSWLNMAKAELSILARQCLDRCIPDVATLEQQVSA